ncbi:MAG: hypothetical protein KY468_10410 [Armatimonadetes bacterium]|nr:hypothetical protein [Armatimonadota bacterium]
MIDNTQNKWKDFLLKSSLPLEMLVSDELLVQGYYTWGEYAYLRKNEDAREVEFSIDVFAGREFEENGLHWGTLNILVECKYNHPSVRWVFNPLPYISSEKNYVSIIDDLSFEQIQRKPFFESLPSFDYCASGIELNSNGFDPNTITRGLSQLRYCLPNLLSDEALKIARAYNDKDQYISFICPMLVTTAPLYLMKSGLTLEDFRNASSLTDVAEEKQVLLSYQKQSLQLDEYSEKAKEHLLKRSPNLISRLRELFPLKYPYSPLPPELLFSYHFSSVTRKILIVNFNSLGDVLHKLKECVFESGKTRSRISGFTLKSGELVPINRE